MKKTFTKILGLVLTLAVIVGCVCAFAACGNNPDDKTTITMYTNATFPPYEWTEGDTKVVGIDVAIMSQVAENLGYKLIVEDGDFDAITQFVKNSKTYAVGAAGISITEDRKKAVDFSNVYANSQLVIIGKAGTNYTSLEQIKNLTVGVQNGTTAHDACKDLTNLKEYDDYATMKSLLINGNQLDVIVMDKLPAQALIKNTSLVVNDVSDVEAEDYGIMFKKGMDKKVVDAINNVIDTWKANGNMSKYSLYYTSLYNYQQGYETKPETNGLKVTWNC